MKSGILVVAAILVVASVVLMFAQSKATKKNIELIKREQDLKYNKGAKKNAKKYKEIA